jgi:ribosome-binding protein aMBF1 (putative translation factor)
MPAAVAHTTFGAGVRSHRRARDLSQRELGAALQRSQSWVWKVEDGHLSPSIDDALALARALGVRLVELLPADQQ